VKNTILMSKKSQKSVCKEDGDLHPDSTYRYSEMPGELDLYKNKQHEKAMKAPINKNLDDDLRKKGLL